MQPKQVLVRKTYGTRGHSILGLHDTGSDDGLIRATAAARLWCVPLASPIEIGGIGAGRAKAHQEAQFQVEVMKRWCRYTALVVPDAAIDVDLLIGEDFLMKYGLLVDARKNKVRVANPYQFERMTRRRLFVASPRGGRR